MCSPQDHVTHTPPRETPACFIWNGLYCGGFEMLIARVYFSLVASPSIHTNSRSLHSFDTCWISAYVCVDVFSSVSGSILTLWFEASLYFSFPTERVDPEVCLSLVFGLADQWFSTGVFSVTIKKWSNTLTNHKVFFFFSIKPTEPTNGLE